MASIANITVKKADNTTDIIYDAICGSGGDSSPAVWRQDTGAAAGLPTGLRPVFKLATQWNNPRTARQAKFNYVRPYYVLNSTTSEYSSKDRVVLDGIATLPQNIPQGELNEAIYQACNLLASALIKQSMATGYSAT